MRSVTYLSAFACYLSLSYASSVGLAKRKGGGHVASSFSSQPHIRSFTAAAAGADSQTTITDECYDTSLNPASHDSNPAWIQANETGYGVGGGMLNNSPI
jgi:hypothetical protein